MSGSMVDTAVRLPAPALRPFITQYAGFRVSGLPSGIHVGLPSSDVDLIISLGQPIRSAANAQRHSNAGNLDRVR